MLRVKDLDCVQRSPMRRNRAHGARGARPYCKSRYLRRADRRNDAKADAIGRPLRESVQLSMSDGGARRYRLPLAANQRINPVRRDPLAILNRLANFDHAYAHRPPKRGDYGW